MSPANHREIDPVIQGKIRRITSGKIVSQQGLVTTCEDLPKRDDRRRQEGDDLSHELIRAMKRE